MYSQATAWSKKEHVHLEDQTPEPASSPPSSLLEEGRRAAWQELAAAARCGCCGSLVDHVFQRVGSTLFLDEDPLLLLEMFSEAERAFITPRVIAACILLTGRERVDVYPKEQSQNWPALRMFIPKDGPQPFRCCAPDVLCHLQKTIGEAQQIAAREKDPSLKQAIAYLWAAVHTLEGHGA